MTIAVTCSFCGEIYRFAATQAGESGLCSCGSSLVVPRADAQIELAPGDVLLDTYEVRSLLGAGGMGTVHLVFHRGWQLELALKSPSVTILARENGTQQFTSEAETWVSLGLHPHIVACHYVREVDGTPRVFAEYVAGGSLADWITDRRLYDGDSLRRILDVATELAWGLAYAHERGLVHRDVKPGNVLLSGRAPTVKVTDFGLSAASGTAASGGTAPYFAPEQASSGTAVAGTDAWSWGLTVLEMFIGERRWMSGLAAPDWIELYDAGDASGPAMPDDLRRLLARCFADDPAARPALADLGDAVAAIRARLTGEPARTAPTTIALAGDAQNNRGASLLDLGDEEGAFKAFRAALSAEPSHPEATYNLAALEWSTGVITDDEAVRRVRQIAEDFPSRDDIASWPILLERARSRSPLTWDGPPASAVARPRCARTHELLASESVALGPDGQRVLVGGAYDLGCFAVDSGEVLWSASDVEAMISDEHMAVAAVVFAPDSRRSLSLMIRGPLCAWDDRGQQLWAITPEAPLRGLAIDPTGHWVVAGAFDGTVRTWELATGTPGKVLRGHDEWVMTIERCGEHVVSAGTDSTFRAWDLATGRCTKVWQCGEPQLRVFATSVDPELRWALRTSSHGIEKWNLEADPPELAGTFQWPGRTTAVALHGRYVLACTDGVLRVWDRFTYGRISAHKLGARHLAIASPRFVVTAGSALRVVDLEPSRRYIVPAMLVKPRGTDELAAHELTFRAHLRDARAAFEQGSRHADTAARALTAARAVPGRSRDAAALELASVLAMRMSARLVHARTLSTRGHIPFTPQSERSGVLVVGVNREATRAFSIGTDETVRQWNLRTGAEEYTVHGVALGQRTGFAAGALDAACRHAAFHRTDSERIELWRLGGDMICALPCAGTPALLAVGPHARSVLIATSAGKTHDYRPLDGVWDAHSSVAATFAADLVAGETLSIDGHGRILIGLGPSATALAEINVGQPSAAAFAERPRVVAIAGTQRTQLYDLDSHHVLATLPAARAVALSPCQRVVALARGNRVEVVLAGDGRQLLDLAAGAADVQQLVYAPDGRYIVGGDTGGGVWIWELEWEVDKRAYAPMQGTSPRVHVCHLRTLLDDWVAELAELADAASDLGAEKRYRAAIGELRELRRLKVWTLVNARELREVTYAAIAHLELPWMQKLTWTL